MKRIVLQAIFALTGAFLSSSSLAQLTQNFNTSVTAPNVADIKPQLQGSCWIFKNMDANNGGFNPAIEGDGAIVSGATPPVGEASGFYTPVLQIPGSVAVNFFYMFDADVNNIAWLNVYLVDCHNQPITQLQGYDLSLMKGNTLYQFSVTYPDLPSGAYKLYVEYESNISNAKIAIDKFETNVPLLYPGGCNTAPVAVNDNIPGNVDRTAAGYVKSNDYDANNDVMATYLIAGSPHGTVTLEENGSFTFTPNPGFAGTSTTFTYQACDNGFGPACSNIATATITFSAGMLPVRLAEFTVSLNNENDALLRWTTTYEQASSHFEIERSFDGSTFETVGTVKAAGTSFGRNEYSFKDPLRNSILNKNDVYYRLRMVDNNNRAEVTKVLVLRLFRTPSVKMISVTPNPVVNDINVQLQLKQDAFVVMKVRNNAGVEVSRKSTRGSEGLNVFSLDGTEKLRPGVYMLEVIINSKERMTVKLMKN